MKHRYALPLSFLLLVLVGVWFAFRFSTSEAGGAGGKAIIRDNSLADVTAAGAAAPVGSGPAPDSAGQKRVAFTKKGKVQHPALDQRALPVVPELSPQQVEGLAELQKALPGVQVDFDPVSRAPARVQVTGKFLSSGVSLAPGQQPDVRGVVEQFINQHRGLFGHAGEALRSARVTREDVSAHNGMTTLVWNQEVKGIPVYKSIFKANVTRRGELVTLSSHFLQNVVVNRDAPVLPAGDAISRAAASLSDVVPASTIQATDAPQGNERRQHFSAPGISDTYAQLTYLPMNEKEARLGWDVTTFSLAANEMFRMVVDAETGEVLVRDSLTADISDASYRVYTSDSPSPFSPGHDEISSVQPAEVPRQLVTIQALDTTASPEGWIPDGGTTTVGNNVQAHTDTDADNSADLPRPTSLTRQFDFPLDLTLEPGNFKPAAITNLFYWSNVFHDRLYQLGFTESAGNFQTNNFGRGGVGNDAVLADAQDGSGTNNANFSTPADGNPGRMQMFLWTGPTPDRDGDFEMEVVLHELGHGVSNRLVGGGVGISSNASAGMGEGWSDFYGLALLAEPGDNLNGNWARGGWSRYQISAGFVENYYYGGRRYPYTVNKRKNPLTLQDIDPSKARAHNAIPRHPYVGNTADQVHNMGNVWCVTLWELRKNLIDKHGFGTGNELAMRLVTDGMKLSPANPNFLQARDGIIQADLVNNAAANAKELWAAFAKRGMGISASAPVATVSVGVNEAYDAPGLLAVTPIAAFNPIGIVGGPMSPTSQSYTLTNNGASVLNWTASKAQSWTDLSATSGSIAPGGTATIVWSINSGADSLAYGEQQDELTITDTGTNAEQRRPLILEINSSPVAQTITFPPLSPKEATAPPFDLAATASSGLTVTYSVVSGPATVSGNTVTLTGATGAVSIRASQAGNAVFLPATNVVRSFVVGAQFSFAKVFANTNGSVSYGLKADGTLWSWGLPNSQGNLGDATTIPRVNPVQVGVATNWVEVSGFSSHWLGVRADSTLWAWGLNTFSQLGDGTTTFRTAPIQIGSGVSWAKVAAGLSHSAAIASNGALYTWGYNLSGQLGLGDTTTRTTPTQVGSATNWAYVSCGSSHTLAVTTTGELWVWGLNSSNQLGDGTTTQSLVPLRIGVDTNWSAVTASLSSSYALKSDGTLWAWGLNSAGQLGMGNLTTRSTPTQVGTGTTWVQVVAGSNNAAARKADGTVWVCGSNAGGQLGNGTTTTSSSMVQFGSQADYASMALGTNHLLTLRSDGSMWVAGESGSASGVWPRALALAAGNTSTFTSLTAGNQVFHALRSDKTLWTWGAGSNSNLGSGSTSDIRTPTQVGVLTDWNVVSDGSTHALAVKTTGTLWAWGTNTNGQLGNGITTSSTPVQIGTATNWSKVAGGGSHSLGVTTAGTLWAWGLNTNGQLGDGTTIQKTAPVQIGTATNWSKISAGSAFSFAITTTGTLWGWGFNSGNQLGDGTTTQRTAPVQIGTATNWSEVSCGTSHSMALRSDGTLWSWGFGSSGQLGSGATTNRTAPTQVGTDTDWVKVFCNGNSTVAIKSDGTLWACGQGYFGQNGDGLIANKLTLTRVGNDRGWTLAVAAASNMAAFRQGVGFFTAGAAGGARTMAGGRDSRQIVPVLPALQPQSLNALSGSYKVYESPISVTTSSGLLPTVSVVSGPATVSGNELTLLASGTVDLLVYSYGDDTAWNAVPPTRVSFTADTGLAVAFPSLGSIGLTRAGFDARYAVLSPTLGFAPTIGTTLTLVNNTSGNAIIGTLAGIPDGGYMTMSYGGVVYGFRVDYSGGDGNDIVLTHEVAPQTITIAQINPKETTDAPFSVTATSTSGEAVTLSIVTGPATVSGNVITLSGTAGAVTVRAQQAGNGLFSAAPDVLHTFAVGTNVKFSRVSAWNHTLAVGGNGWLWASGNNTNSQLGDGTATTFYTLKRIGSATDWSSVAAGSTHSLGVKTGGTLWAWGANTSNQLGDGTTTTRNVPTQIGAATNWGSVYGGGSHSMGLRTDGTLWTWGLNTSGQLGDGTTVNRTAPTQISLAIDWAQVSAGSDHCFAIKTNGTLWAWGLNTSGQLGDGSTVNKLTPVQIGMDTNWSKVSGSFSHSLAVKTDGTLWAWGLNSSGQLGDGTTTQRLVPVRVGFAADWVAVMAGANYSRAVKVDGSIWAWGLNTQGQLADGTATNRLAPQRVGSAADWASASGFSTYTAALKADGTLWAWGNATASNSAGFRPRAMARAMPAGPNVQLSTGNGHSYVTRSDGSIWAFGTGTNGQLGNSSTSFNLNPTQTGSLLTWQAARAGDGYTMGLRQDGTLWGWGTNLSYQLGDGTTSTRTSPVQITLTNDWAQVAAAPTGFHTMAIKTGGTLWVWGSNLSSQLGLGDTTTRTTPTQLGTDTNWSKVVCGGACSYGIRTNGTLWAWGLNSSFQLGDGTSTTRTTPVQIGTDTNWADVSSNTTFACALKTDGSLWVWGSNGNGQLGLGDTTTRTTPTRVGTGTDWVKISAGSGHAAAIKSDGTLWLWGNNNIGQLGFGDILQRNEPTQLGTSSGWIAVSAGNLHTTAMRNDGSVWSMGSSGGMRNTTTAGRSQYEVAAVVPELSPQTVSTTPVGTNPYRFTASSGLPVQLSLVSGQATITGDEVNVTGAPGAPVVVLAWQPGDEVAWNAAGPHEIVIGTLTAPTVDSLAHTNVDGSGADLTATVNANGGLTTVSFQYGTSPTLATFTTTSSVSAGSGTTSAATTPINISGLSELTTYYYRAVATNAGGSTSSAIQSFTTLGRDITVEQPTGSARVSGDVVAFGDVTLGTSLPQTFTIKNDVPGTSISVGTISLTGADTGMFSLNTTGMSTSVSGGLSTSFTVTFTPTLSGARTVTLTIPNNDPDENPFLFTLTANGQAVPGPSQSILGPSTLSNRLVSQGSFTLPYIASSGLAPVFTVVGGSGGSVSGGVFTPAVGGGPVTVRIQQAGGSGFDPATTVYRTFNVGVGSFSKLAAGSTANHGVGIKSDQTLWAWGRNNAGQLGLGNSVDRHAPVQVGATTWTSAAVGAEFTVAIRTNGSLWAWGRNTDGQLGLADTVDRNTPTQVGVATTWVQVAAGANFVIAVQSNGTLWAWGGNASSQLGLGDTAARSSPTQVGVATNWYSSTHTTPTVAAGTAHALARNSSGQLFAWGLNTNGQLGMGDTSTRTAPTQVGVVTTWACLSCGPSSSFALQGTTGSLWAWGLNTFYMLGDGTTTTRSSPVQIGTSTVWNFVAAGGGHALARRSDGSIWSWGGNTSVGATGQGDASTRTAPTRIGTENNWSALSAGNLHSIATKTDGTLWTAGASNYGQLAHPEPRLSAIANGVVAIGENQFSSHYIRSDGTLWGVGSNYSDVGDGTNTRRTQPVQIGTDTNWQSLAAGQTHSFALRSNGTLWANGLNSSNQLGDGTSVTRNSFVQIGTATDWSKISAGNSHGVGIKTDGTLWAWGLNSSGQLGDGTTTSRTSPTQIGAATDWQSVECGGLYTVAIKTDGSLWAWGSNAFGQLGDGSTTQRNAPVRVGVDNDWVKVSAGFAFTLALKTDGSLWAWGLNTSGQLGDGSTTQRNAPVRVGVLNSWAHIDAGYQHSIALQADGTAWGWGANFYAQTGTGSTVDSATPTQIAPGTNSWALLGNGMNLHTLLATADGTLFGVGSNADYQTTSSSRVNSLLDYAHPGTAVQSIAFPTVAFPSYNTPVALLATASSGLPVSYCVSGPATLSGNLLTVTGPGEVKVLAYQNGDRPTWHTAPVVQASVVSSNAALSGLAVSSGTLSPVFSSAVLSYEAGVPNAVTSVTVTPTALYPGTTLTVNGVAVSSGAASAALPLSVGVNTLTINATAQDGITTLSYIISMRRQSVFEAWAATQSLPSTPTADTDGDGVPNLLEFAFGLNPASNDNLSIAADGSTRGMPVPLPPTSSTRFKAIFGRRTDHASSGLIYTVQFSSDMSGWNSSVVTPTVISDDGVMQAVTVPYPLFLPDGRKARFFRVQVTQAP